MDPKDIKTVDMLDDPQFEKDVLQLEADLHVLGWDQPHAIYAVMGEPGDLRLEKITDMSGHPVDWMRTVLLGDKEAGIDPGGPLRDTVAGVAVANEGWRHPHARDFEKRWPEDWKMFMDLAELTGVTDMEDIYKHIDNALRRLHEQIPPHANPRRIEIRSVMVLMRDGKGVGVNRSRDEEAEVFRMGDGGRLIQAMRAMLTGCWPADEAMNTPTKERE